MTENRQTPQGLRALKSRKGFVGGDKGLRPQLWQILCDFEKTELFVVSTLPIALGTQEADSGGLKV